MKIAIASTAALAAALAVGVAPALAKPGPEVEIDHAVARVVVIVEDRADIGVEIDQGTSGLPALRVERRGDDIHIDGGLGRRVAGINLGDRIRNCRPGPANAAAPGDGASVEVRDVGRVNVATAPMIVLRVPREVKVDAGGAVFGSVGRGAASVDLGTSGCGSWNVANTDGRISLGVSGSGDIRVGTSSALEAGISGVGSIAAGATRNLDVSVSGAGDVMVARVDGPAEISVSGVGDVAVRAGTAPTLSVSVSGAGDVDFKGVAGDVDVSLAGAGDVSIARATGSVSRSVSGVGDVRIGQ